MNKPSQEMLDVLDCTGGKTGRIISRDEAHESGIWHGAFHCMIIYEREGKGCALFQKRSSRKKITPGLLDVSVGGHYAAGEDAESAGPREIREELGLEVGFSDLVPLGRRVCVYCFTPGVMEYEFQDVYLLPRRVDMRGLALQEGEVDAVLELGIETGIGLFIGAVSRAGGLQIWRDGKEERKSVSAAEFVPCLDNYYLKLLLLAQRYLRGERKALVI